VSRLVPLVLAALVAACSSTPVAISTTTTQSPPPISEPVVELPGYEMRTCTSAQSRPWSVLCRAVQLIATSHIDSPEMASLAAAAVAGVQRAQDPGGVSAPAQSGPLNCVVPTGAFEGLCEAIALRNQLEGLAVQSLVEAAVQGIFRLGLDPFSAYLDPDYANRLDSLGSGHVYSLGMILGARSVDGGSCGPIGQGCDFVVLTVFDFGPAYEAGVLLGDVVETIDGRPVVGLSETEAVAALQAQPGVTTTMTVRRASGETVKAMVHEDIRFEPVEFTMITPDVAYLRVNEFSQEAAQLVGQVLQRDEVQAASGMILDLRDNPGGLVLSAQAVASQFLDGGLVMVEETRQGSYEVPVLAGGLADSGLQLVVLTNRGTASASEVVAAALQARGRALIVGGPTFGKNLIQQVFTAPGGGEYRISVARWVGPAGADIGGRGVQPDVAIEDDIATDIDEVAQTAFQLLTS
jgi:carboxyl-terminal processing protease